MIYKNLKLFRQTENIIIPPTGLDGKPICLFFFGENTSFLDSYNFLNIKPVYVKFYYQPTILKPILSRIDSDHRKKIKELNLIPAMSNIGNYSKLPDKNFFYDGSIFIDSLESKFNFTKYNTGRPYNYLHSYIMSLDALDSNVYHKCILYAVNLDKHVSKNIFFRRFFILYEMILKFQKGDLPSLPFDDIVLFLYNSEGGRYVKIFGKHEGSENSILRVKTIISKIRDDKELINPDNKNDMEDIAKNINNVVHPERTDLQAKEKTTDKLISSVKNFITSNNPKIYSKDLDDDKKTKSLANTSIVYNSTGDINRTRAIMRRMATLPENQQSKIINKFNKYVLPKNDPTNTTTNKIIFLSNPVNMVDNNWPEHILKKRINDFEVYLKNDIKEAFNMLTTKDFPLTVENIDMVKIEPSPADILKTDKVRFNVKLKDKDDAVHSVYIDVPNIDKFGIMTINGRKRMVINQLLRFPIFFPRVNEGRFESSFSTMRVISKQLRTGAYYIFFIGSYKFPMLEFLAYRHGFDSVMEKYGVKYKILD